jgi:hypothetical protein
VLMITDPFRIASVDKKGTVFGVGAVSTFAIEACCYCRQRMEVVMALIVRACTEEASHGDRLADGCGMTLALADGASLNQGASVDNWEGIGRAPCCTKTYRLLEDSLEI